MKVLTNQNKSVILFSAMKGLLFSLAFLALPWTWAYANPADKRTYQDVDTSIYKTSGVRTNETANISSGVVKVDGIYVASACINCEVRFYDNFMVGASSNQIGVAIPLTVRGAIPFKHETERGLILVSTAASTDIVTTTATWNLTYRRVR